MSGVAARIRHYSVAKHVNLETFVQRWSRLKGEGEDFLANVESNNFN